jgi:hypothetical protein
LLTVVKFDFGGQAQVALSAARLVKAGQYRYKSNNEVDITLVAMI